MGIDIIVAVVHVGHLCAFLQHSTTTLIEPITVTTGMYKIIIMMIMIFVSSTLSLSSKNA